MRIAVINEVSASPKNADILAALAEFSEHTVYNVGMASPEDKPDSPLRSRFLPCWWLRMQYKICLTNRVRK